MEGIMTPSLKPYFRVPKCSVESNILSADSKLEFVEKSIEKAGGGPPQAD